MFKPLPIIVALGALSLSACEHKPQTVDNRAPDPMASELANAAPVELPPAIRESVSFRCDDNSLAFIDFFKGDKQVNFRSKKGTSPTLLKSEEAGGPWTDGAITVSGDPEQVTYSKGGEELTCKA